VKGARLHIQVQAEDFDIHAEMERARHNNQAIGAAVSFVGYCRDENGTLSALELEHYPEMSQKQLTAIATSASDRWQLYSITIIHRYGKIAAGEQIVLVIVTSSHRHDAFLAASFLMDFLKTDAPFWKKEHLKNGETCGWVSAREHDTLMRNKWNGDD